MSTQQDRTALRRISEIRPEEVAAHVREAQRLRSAAIRKMLGSLAQGLGRAFRREAPRKPAVRQGL